MRKIFTLFAALCTALCMWADGTEIDGIHYILKGDSAVVTYISWTGNSYSGDITIPSSVNYSGKTYRVTRIGNDAFDECSGLTSITIPNSVKSIGFDAFHGCSSLSSVTFGNSVAIIEEGAFTSCSALTSVSIPSSVTCIGKYAFQYCLGLSSITIPSSVDSIGDRAFASCSGLTSIVVEAGNTKYDSRNNCNALIETSSNTLITGCQNTTIPNTVDSIENYAFYNCSGLSSIAIPNSVKSIGIWAFADCTSLTSIAIPNSVTRIEEHTFYDCTGLTSVTIPNSVKSIGYCAFMICTNLSSITIPSSVDSIETQAFVACTHLDSIAVEAGNAKYDSRNNCNAIIETSSNTLIAGCKNTIIPNTIDSLGMGAFYYSDITSITIPSSVIRIGDYAFCGCSDLSTITCDATTPPTLGEYIFYSVNPSIPLYVPEGSVSLYQAADQWKDFTNIQAAQATGVEDVCDNATPDAKILMDGKVYLRHGNKLFDLNGKQLK